MTRMRSESERISSSSSETSRTALPSSRSATMRRCRYSIAPTSRPRVGWAAIEHLRVARDLAGDDDLLLVPAGQPAGARERAAAADVELADQPRRALDEPRREQPAPPRVRRLRVVVQRDVLRDRELEHEPAPLPVLGDVADAGVEHPPRRRLVQLAAGDLDRRPLACFRRPVIASISSVWPLPSTPAMPTISPARTSKEMPRTLAMPRSSLTWRSSTASRTSPGCAGVFSTWSRTSRPTIARASDASVAPSRGTVSIFLPRRSTVIRSAISSTSFSLWLMKMIDFPSALRLRMMPKSSCASCGVSTAVGSSRMRSPRRGRAPSGSRRAAPARP